MRKLALGLGLLAGAFAGGALAAKEMARKEVTQQNLNDLDWKEIMAGMPIMQAEAWKGPYIKRGVPNDPWGNPYVYRFPGQHNVNSYDLHSFGPDGHEGGDDIDNWSQQH